MDLKSQKPVRTCKKKIDVHWDILEYIGQHSPELFKWWRWWRFWGSISNYVIHHVSPKQTLAVATQEDSIVGRLVLLSIPSDITLLGTASTVFKKCGVGNLEVWFALGFRPFWGSSFKVRSSCHMLLSTAIYWTNMTQTLPFQMLSKVTWSCTLGHKFLNCTWESRLSPGVPIIDHNCILTNGCYQPIPNWWVLYLVHHILPSLYWL